MFECANNYNANVECHAIITGSISNTDETKTTYGGVLRAGLWQQTKFNRVNASTRINQCDTMNGNCVLIPAVIANSLGSLEESFSHNMGDFDYGLRAKKLGYDIVIAPNFIGQCERNSQVGTYDDTSLSLKTRIKLMFSPKGLPLKTWWTFTRRHAGIFWLLYFFWPYFRVILSSLFSSLFKKKNTHN